MTRFVVILILAVFCNGCRNETGKMFTELDRDETGIDFRNLLVEDETLNVAHYIYFYNGAGVAIGDINNDGLQDVFFTGNMVKNRLFLNKGNFEFENITVKSGVAEKQGWCTGASMVDVNQDGNMDIYVCRSADGDPERRKNLLFINQGDLTFREEAEKYGLADNGYSTQATFFDYDKDGDLDCFVLNHSVSKYSVGVTENPELRKVKNPDYASRLYRNDNGRFIDVSEQAGVESNVLSFGLGVALSDFNNDGWTDIYVSNDFKESDYLYLNNGNGTFTESFAKCMDIASLNSMGSDAADYNNDGHTDLVTLDMLAEDNYLQKTHAGPHNFDKTNLLITKGFQPQYMRNMLQKNNGDGTFSEVGQLAGISNTDWSWSALFADFDADGLKDLFVSNGFVKDFSDLDFINYSTDKLIRKNRGENVGSFKDNIDLMPTIKLPNYLFRNGKDGVFKNITASWGLDKPAISSGAAYADLDNDGDMDLVVSNTNDYAFVYRNNAIEHTKNNYLRLKLEGAAHNRDGIGTKVKVYNNRELYFQEQFPARGYQSSVDMILNFGLGKATDVDSVVVIWPNDQYEVLTNVRANQTLVVKASNARSRFMFTPATKETTLVEAKVTGSAHTENAFNDFTVQTLLLNYLSRQGPCMAIADVNKDGREDVYLGGAKGKPGQLLLQSGSGELMRANAPALVNDSMYEDVAAEFFDADGDGDVDLYVGSGGYEFAENDVLLQDRLYFNDGKGKFTRNIDALPDFVIPTGCVKAGDADGDGDYDLYVGGRLTPGKYPLPVASRLFINNGKGIFSNAGAEAASIQQAGMVTDAAWVDLNNDKRLDLVIVGEWMPVRILLNTTNGWKDASSDYISFPSTGWWNRILVEDYDGDGYKDIVLGNQGINTQFKVSEKEPATLYYSDFDGNGSIDPIFCYYIQGKSYPAASRDDLVEQLPGLKKKYNEYAKYAKATLNDIFTGEQLKNAQVLKAELLSTIYLRNNGGKSLVLAPLPVEIQYAPVHAMAAMDVNHDGAKDLVVAGNNTWTRVQFGRHLSNHGMLFLGDGKGSFTYLPQFKSGLHVKGDVRSMGVLKKGKTGVLLMGMNNGPVTAYTVSQKVNN